MCAQSRPTLCDPVDCRPPSSSVHRIFQAKILAWVAISPPGDFLDSGIELVSPVSPALQADSVMLEPLHCIGNWQDRCRGWIWQRPDVSRCCCCCCCSVASVVSNSVRPHRRQPTRLSRPWDSPGKNTGVGCHFLLQCMKLKSESEITQSCLTLHDPMDCTPPGSSIHGIWGPSYLVYILYTTTKIHLRVLTLYSSLGD